jgi:uncharacterized protein (TIGR02996 family)
LQEVGSTHPQEAAVKEDDFLQHILANPDDETARLAYADWLLEHGDGAAAARAEFIQVQCRLARWSGEFSSWDQWAEAAEQLPHLRRREQALLEAHRAAWAAGVLPLVTSLEFRRGFVENIKVYAPTFLQNAERIFQRAPVQRVHFATFYNQAAAVAQSPYLGRLTAIDLSGASVRAVDLQALLASPHLGRLTELNLSRTYFPDDGARVLAESPRLAQLRVLDLSYNHLTPEGVRALAQSRYRGPLRSLNLEGNPRLGQQGMTALATTLSGTPEPGVLQSLLHALRVREQPFSNAAARGLARRVAGAPAQAAAMLTRALGDSNFKARAAAAQMLARLGAEAAASVPALVRRLYEPNATVRESVAPTLAALLPALPAEVQTWLCILAQPLRSAEANLEAALTGDRPLPVVVRHAFADLCARRAAWRARHAGQEHAPGPPAATDSRSLWQAAQALGGQAADAVARHPPAEQELSQAQDCARTKEYAWLLARLCELLLREQAV